MNLQNQLILCQLLAAEVLADGVSLLDEAISEDGHGSGAVGLDEGLALSGISLFKDIKKCIVYSTWNCLSYSYQIHNFQLKWLFLKEMNCRELVDKKLHKKYFKMIAIYSTWLSQKRNPVTLSKTLLMKASFLKSSDKLVMSPAQVSQSKALKYKKGKLVTLEIFERMGK
jgi:hypothetical protein